MLGTVAPHEGRHPSRARMGHRMALNLETPRKTTSRLRRCFISAQSGGASEALARALATHGVESLRADDLAPGERIVPEILRHLQAVDFVCALDDGGPATPSVFFELGAAHILRKPILLFTTGYSQLLSGLHGIYVIKAKPDDLSSVSPEIDRFLRNAKPLPPLNAAPAKNIQKPNLSWAREELAALRDERPADRGLRFERLVAEVFRRAGSEIVGAELPERRNADVLVWLDDVSYEIGGPLIVECKYFGGRSGSALTNARRAVEQLDKIVAASDTGLALLVYGHDRPAPPPSLTETPRVLALPIEELIQALEDGTLPEDILRRRQRAGYAKVSAGGSD